MKYPALRLFGAMGPIFRSDPSVFARWRWVARHLDRGPCKTLDVGCGGGPLTFYAAKIGNAAVGVDSDEESILRAKDMTAFLGIKNLSFRIRDVRNLDAEAQDAERYDQIICSEVIEHILNDQKLLADMADLLVGEGRLLLTTPYKYYRRLIGDALSQTEDGGHVRWGYTHDEMRHLCSKAKLRVIREDYVCGFICRMLVSWKRLLEKFMSQNMAWLIMLPLRAFLMIDPLVTWILRYPYSCIAIVAVKEPFVTEKESQE